MGIFINCLRRFGNSWGRKGSLDMESLKETSTPDLAMSNSWAEGNQSPSYNEEKGGLSYLDLPPGMTSLPGSESPIDTRRKGGGPVQRSAASPQALLALPPQRARSRPGSTCPLARFGGSPVAPGSNNPQPLPTPGRRAAGRAPQARGAAGILRNLQFSYSVRVTAW